MPGAGWEHPSPTLGANSVSFPPPPAYKTVCGVNGPLVVLDNVKVGACLPAGDTGTARRCDFGLRGDHRAVPCLALGFPGGEGAMGEHVPCPTSPVPWAVPSSPGSLSQLRAPSPGDGWQQSPCASVHTRVGQQACVSRAAVCACCLGTLRSPCVPPPAPRHLLSPVSLSELQLLSRASLPTLASSPEPVLSETTARNPSSARPPGTGWHFGGTPCLSLLLEQGLGSLGWAHPHVARLAGTLRGVLLAGGLFL